MMRAACAALTLHLTACGTILHPERKGQRDGRLDAGVVVLDAIGLLFFIIPGVIAFAVDFSNGTIYLPGTKGQGGIGAAPRTLRFDPKDRSLASLEKRLEAETGRPLCLDRAQVVPYTGAAAR